MNHNHDVLATTATGGLLAFVNLAQIQTALGCLISAAIATYWITKTIRYLRHKRTPDSDPDHKTD